MTEGEGSCFLHEPRKSFWHHRSLFCSIQLFQMLGELRLRGVHRWISINTHESRTKAWKVSRSLGQPNFSSEILSAMTSYPSAAKPQDDELVWLLLGRVLSINRGLLGMFQALSSPTVFFGCFVLFSSVEYYMEAHAPTDRSFRRTGMFCTRAAVRLLALTLLHQLEPALHTTRATEVELSLAFFLSEESKNTCLVRVQLAMGDAVDLKWLKRLLKERWPVFWDANGKDEKKQHCTERQILEKYQ